MAPSRAVQRLERLLAVVPYVVGHPGVTLKELMRVFGVTEVELTEDLNLLFLTGLPPYTPDELVEVRVERGRVWVSMADHFSRPVRLTRSEAVALYLRGSALLGTPGLREAEPLRSALRKLEEGLGPDTLGELRVDVREGGALPPLEAIRRAAARRVRIVIEYYSANRDELSTRTIEPEQVFSAIGNWYVAAWDVDADAERLFRVDRIKEVRRTRTRFASRGLAGYGRALYSGSAEDIRVRLRLGPGARWVGEYYEVEEARTVGDELEVVLPTKDLAWVAKLLLRLGGEARVLDPPELREGARSVADATLARYRDASA